MRARLQMKSFAGWKTPATKWNECRKLRRFARTARHVCRSMQPEKAKLLAVWAGLTIQSKHSLKSFWQIECSFRSTLWIRKTSHASCAFWSIRNHHSTVKRQRNCVEWLQKTDSDFLSYAFQSYLRAPRHDLPPTTSSIYWQAFVLMITKQRRTRGSFPSRPPLTTTTFSISFCAAS